MVFASYQQISNDNAKLWLDNYSFFVSEFVAIRNQLLVILLTEKVLSIILQKLFNIHHKY